MPLGERVRLSCVVRGNPRPTVEWRADGARIVPEADRGRRGMASHSVESEVAERAVSTHMDVVFHGEIDRANKNRLCSKGLRRDSTKF